MFCKNCGNKLENRAAICPNCGFRLETPVYRKVWFWLLMVLASLYLCCFVMPVLLSFFPMFTSSDTSNATSIVSETTNSKKANIKTYKKVELQKMIDDLESNPFNAEKTYKNKYVQITGVITSFSSYGRYIYIESTTAEDYNFHTIMCYIKNDKQQEQLTDKSKGDRITIIGKVTSVSEMSGYEIEIGKIK